MIGEFSIIVSDGTELRARTDLGLAWAWAEYEVNANPELDNWDEIGYRAQVQHAADALFALREALGPVTD